MTYKKGHRETEISVNYDIPDRFNLQTFLFHT